MAEPRGFERVFAVWGIPLDSRSLGDGGFMGLGFKGLEV